MRVAFSTNVDVARMQTWPTLKRAPEIGSRVRSRDGMALDVTHVLYEFDWDYKSTVCIVELSVPSEYETLEAFLEAERLRNA